MNDLVRLKIRDVKNRNLFYIREGKTNKRRKIYINMLQAEIIRFIDGKHPNQYLLKSQKEKNIFNNTSVMLF